MTWQIVKLGEIFNFLPKSKFQASNGKENGKYKFFTSSPIQKKWIDTATFDVEALVFGTGGSASIHHVDGGFSTSTDCFVLAPKNNEELFAKYAYYYISSNLHILEEGFKGAGLKHISKKYIHDLEIPLPPYAEQQRIAEILDKAELVKRKRELAIEKLDELEQSIFEEMFGNPMLNPNGYEIKQLQDLTNPEDTINYGVVQPGDSLAEGIPLIRVGDLVNKKLSAHEIKKIDPVIDSAYKRSRLKGTEILLSCVGSIGTVVLATNEMKGFNIARAVARIQLLPKYNRVYVASYLRTNKVQNYFTKELRTVSQPTLNIKQICETPVIIPPDEQQILYAKCIEHLEKLRQRYLNSCEIVFKVNESIKFELFSGSP
jgi:type I restriction enzyme S subunit